jgi:hypothetical protein
MSLFKYCQNHPGVAYAEPDHPIRFDLIPDDPDFMNQWALRNTGQVYKPK